MSKHGYDFTTFKQKRLVAFLQHYTETVEEIEAEKKAGEILSSSDKTSLALFTKQRDKVLAEIAQRKAAGTWN